MSTENQRLDAYLDLIERDRCEGASELMLAREIRRLREVVAQQTKALKKKQNRIRHLEQRRDAIGTTLRSVEGERRRLSAAVMDLADHQRHTPFKTTTLGCAAAPACPHCFASGTRVSWTGPSSPSSPLMASWTSSVSPPTTTAAT